MAVLSFPVKCKNSAGDYSFFGDFSENEQHVHHDCLRQTASKLMEILCGKKSFKPNVITVEDEPEEQDEPELVPPRKLLMALKGLEAEASLEDVKEFLKGHPDEPLEELIRLWFQQQDSVV